MSDLLAEFSAIATMFLILAMMGAITLTWSFFGMAIAAYILTLIFWKLLDFLLEVLAYVFA